MNNSLDLHLRTKEFSTRPALSKNHSRTNSGNSDILAALSRIHLSRGALTLRTKKTEESCSLLHAGVSANLSKEGLARPRDKQPPQPDQTPRHAALPRTRTARNCAFYRLAGAKVEQLASRALRPVLTLRQSSTVTQVTEIVELEPPPCARKERTPAKKRTNLLDAMRKIQVIGKNERVRSPAHPVGDKVKPGLHPAAFYDGHLLENARAHRQPFVIRANPAKQAAALVKLPPSLEEQMSKKSLSQKPPEEKAAVQSPVDTQQAESAPSLIRLKKKARSLSYSQRSPAPAPQSARGDLQAYKDWLLSDACTRLISRMVAAKSHN